MNDNIIIITGIYNLFEHQTILLLLIISFILMIYLVLLIKYRYFMEKVECLSLASGAYV